MPSSAGSGRAPAPEELTRLKAVFDGAMAGLDAVEPKQLFGCDGYFANGNIFGLVWKEGRLGLRLTDDADREELLALEGAGPWKVGPMTMKHWVLLPPLWHRQPAKLKQWARKAWASAMERPEKSSITGKAKGAKVIRPAVFRKLKRDEK